MSVENTAFDIRIALYDGSKKPLAQIVFYNDTELLLECKRVKVVRDGNRLYFHKADSTGGIKLSTATKDRLQLWSDYSKVKDLEGRYDLKYDKSVDLYYIDKSEKISEDDLSRRGSVKGTKQLNHNPGKREKGEQKIMAPVKITEKGKKAVEIVQRKEKESNNVVVVKALVALLKTQVKGNAEALSTIDTLEKFI